MVHEQTEEKLSAGFLLGLLLIEFLFLVFAGGTLLLASGQALSPMVLPLSLLLTLVTIVACYYRGYCRFNRAIGLAVTTLLLPAMAVLLAGSYFDISWDGQTYHQEAILRLSQGWNPWVNELANLFSVPMQALEAAINFYPKGPWITAAAFNLFFHDIESGKAIFWLLAAAAALISFSWLKDDLGVPPLTAVALVGAMLLSPVAVSQSLSYYIDGQVYYLLVIVLVCLAVALQSRPIPLPVYPLFLMSISLLLNSKIPAIAFSGFFLFVFVIFALVRIFLRRDNRLVAPVIVFSFSALFGLIAMGFHPYVTNTLERGNPLYPVAGEGKIVTIKGTRPDDFKTMNRFEMFYRSLFARSDNPPFLEERESRLKVPFDVIWPQEAQVFRTADPRTGGFGPLFSGVLLLSVGFALVIGLARQRGRQLGLAAGVVVVLTASALLHPEAWWARYVPQFYLAPIVFAIFLAAMPGFIPRFSAIVISGLLIANGLAAAMFYYPYNAEYTRKINTQLEQLGSRELNEINFLEFRSNRARLQQRGIPFVELTASQGFHCADTEYFPLSRTFLCIGREGVLPKGAFACKSQDLLQVWRSLPETGRNALLKKGACMTSPGSVRARVQGGAGGYVQLGLVLTDGSEQVMWTLEKFMPDPTTGTIP